MTINFTASFLGGPLDKTKRHLEKDEPFIKIDFFEAAKHPTPDDPSTFPTIAHHVYELDVARLVLGDEAHIFYHYIGLDHEGDLI